MQRITLLAGLDAFRGYGLHLIEIVRALERRGIKPSIRAIQNNDGAMGSTVPTDVRKHLVTGVQPEPWEILLAPPVHAPTPGKKTCYLTMWESDELPVDYVNYVNAAEIVVVPSRFCAETFHRSGVKRPIYIVPLGVNTDVFKYRRMDMSGPTKFFAAGRTAHGRERKGLDAVIWSFLAAFPYDDGVRLLVKCHQDCQLPFISDPRVTLWREHQTDNVLAHTLGEATCFVSGATGEGWGLWQHQAMAVGRPVIAAVYGGLREFMGLGNCYPVDYLERPTNEGWCGKWACPDLGSMVEQMRWVHGNRQDAADVGRRAWQTVMDLTWERHCDELFYILGLQGALTQTEGVFFLPSLIQGDHNPRTAPSIPEQCRARGWKCEVMQVEKDPGKAVFNPTVAKDEDTGEVWIARHSDTTDGNRWNSKLVHLFPQVMYTEKALALTPPAEKGGPIQFLYEDIDIPISDGENIEDPRALFAGEQFAVSFTRCVGGKPPTQEIAFIDINWKITEVWHPRIGHNGTDVTNATYPEKNWVWFNHEGDWHVIYWLEPMQVYRVESGKPVGRWETNKFNPQWAHGIRHGGGSPTRIGDEYFGFCHSLMPWFSRNRSRYFISAYAFEAKPPFAMTRMARVPLLASEDIWRDNPCSCVICGGAILRNGVWTLAIGAKDEECIRVEIPHVDVLKTLDAV